MYFSWKRKGVIGCGMVASAALVGTVFFGIQLFYVLVGLSVVFAATMEVLVRVEAPSPPPHNPT